MDRNLPPVSAFKRWFQPALGAVAAMLLHGAAAHAGPSLDRIKASGKITLAYQPGPPFAYAVEQGKPMGYAIDLCLKLSEAVRKALDMKALQVEYLPVASAERLPVMLAQKADLECGSTTNNEVRRQSVAFTVPHYITGTRYAVRSGSPIDSLRDFEGKKLVSTAGSTPLASVTKAAQEGLLRIQVISVASVEEAISMVESGAADGFAMDDVLLYALIADRPDPSKLKVVGKFLTIEPLAIMLPKNDPELKRIVDAEMKRMIYGKEAQALYQRWFEQPIPPKGRSLNMPMNYLLKDFWKLPTDWVPN
jgi:ABC-type amino acid transport substrate-binding protein